ncbi:MAG: peptidoglycan-binding protein, partial [Polyangiales bacterium]
AGLTLLVSSKTAAAQAGTGYPDVKTTSGGAMSTTEAQGLLNKAGAVPQLAVDGIVGPATTAAIKTFQRAHGLAVDGIIGPQTLAALRAV